MLIFLILASQLILLLNYPYIFGYPIIGNEPYYYYTF